jgi:hypothetical protein
MSKRSQGTIQLRADGSHEQMEEFGSERKTDRRSFRNKKVDAIRWNNKKKERIIIAKEGCNK